MEIENSVTLYYNSNTIIKGDIGMESATISVRTTKQLKDETEAIFDELGMNLSTAINTFLKQVVIHRGLPFEVKLEKPNRKTMKSIKRVETFIKTGKGKKHFVECDSVDDMKKKLGV